MLRIQPLFPSRTRTGFNSSALSIFWAILLETNNKSSTTERRWWRHWRTA
jgi:hypothetical protein